jgi:molybdopterin synthase catalytic subunit
MSEAPLEGTPAIRVVVSTDAIDVAAEHAALEQGGAVATFTGLVRADDGVATLELEHYPGATEAALTRLAEEAARRWSLAAVTIVHRVGPMRPGERIVFTSAASAHRAAALEACAFLIDRLKTDTPFWKREVVDGHGRWVEARDSDDHAADRWR